MRTLGKCIAVLVASLVLAFLFIVGDANAKVTTTKCHKNKVCLRQPPKLKHKPRLIVPITYSEWSNVAHCEGNDNWEVLGSAYPDSLGITAANWRAAGGVALTPTSYEPLKVRYYEVHIADRFRAQYGNFSFPDQPYGNCTGAY